MGFENDSGYTITNLRSLTQQHSSSVAQVPFSLNNRTSGVMCGKDKPGSPFFGKEDPFWGDANANRISFMPCLQTGISGQGQAVYTDSFQALLKNR